MKRLSLVLIAAAVVLVGTDNARCESASAQWMSNYTKAISQTQESGKPLLVVVDDPSNPQLALQQTSEKLTPAETDLLAKYERCHVDVKTEHGKLVAKAFGAKQFPFVAIIDKTGTGVLYQNSGKMDMGTWIEKLKAYSDGQIPANHVVTPRKTTRKRTTASSSRSRRTTTSSSCYT